MTDTADAAAAAAICSQIQSVFSAARPHGFPSPASVLVSEVTAAARAPLPSKVFVHGVGREGLMLRAFCMRLFHLGLAAHVVGDVTAPPIGPGDLLVVSAGPGYFSTVDAICGVAKAAGARVVALTAQPGAMRSALLGADAIACLPAQTMADDQEEGKGGDQVRLPMGSTYEGAMFVLFELVVLRLATELGQSPAQLRARHTNLE
ncbi:hypothetical protein HK405_004915 [Cladochytrium tenue]|nr:hypothetical protein HK405_004915 [Cladochytrium tenue]